MIAVAGFQHFVQPQAWSWASAPVIATFIGAVGHLHTSVPPAKFAPAAVTPWSIEGCRGGKSPICVLAQAMTSLPNEGVASVVI